MINVWTEHATSTFRKFIFLLCCFDPLKIDKAKIKVLIDGKGDSRSCDGVATGLFSSLSWWKSRQWQPKETWPVYRRSVDTPVKGKGKVSRTSTGNNERQLINLFLERKSKCFFLTVSRVFPQNSLKSQEKKTKHTIHDETAPAVLWFCHSSSKLVSGNRQ